MSLKILVVDDEPDFQLVIRQKFRPQIAAQEMQFVFAENGAQALEKLQEQRGIDIVLTDINMPVMNGLALLNELLTSYPLLRSVVVSAYGDMQNIRTAMNRGAFDFLIKPVNFEDLEITVKKTQQAVQQLKESLRLQQEKIELELRHQFVRATFGRYVSDEVVEIQILISEATLKATGPAVSVSQQIMMEAKGFEELVTLYEVQGVAGTYDLFLPSRSADLVALARPVAVQCTIFEGKHARGGGFNAHFVKLSLRGGEIRSTQPVAFSASVKMRLSDFDGKGIPADLYGKAISPAPGEPLGFHVHFTSTPPEVLEFFRRVFADNPTP